ncbi:MAG TPA: bifunctional ADP-heptose synthase [Thermomicrobiales bacterium]|nr:bifunctional ADP-heptose synthase [Thermomicrobiales bacterium]
MLDPTSSAGLLDLLNRIGGSRVLVVGDLYLDRYIFGHPSRVSREAPIMVLTEDRQEDRLGGGTAPALALARLGCEVAICGVIGNDPEGQRVRTLLSDVGIDTDGVIIDPTRPTTVKTRVVAEGFFLFPQQVVRIDRQDRSPVSPAVEGSLRAVVESSRCDAMLVSDYRSGVVTTSLVAGIADRQGRDNILTTVDSQGDLFRFTGFGLVKCNQGEAEQTLGHSLGDRASRAADLAALRHQLGCRTLVVTRGGDGASLAGEDGYREIPAANRSEVFDVTGAGDTVVAVMTAALLAGGTPEQASHLAQAAAGVVVRKWSNAQASRAEIAAALVD